MPIGRLRAAIGQQALDRNPVLGTERQHAVTEGVRAVTGVLSIYRLAKPTLASVSMKVCW